MHVETVGAGADVICVHGAAGDFRQWLPIAKILGSGYRVTAYSRQHHWPDTTDAAHDAIVYTHESHRDDLVAMLRSLARPADVVGHSYGAGVALLASLQAPDLVRRLVLIEPAFASLLPASREGLDAEMRTRVKVVHDVKALSAAHQHDRAIEVLFDWIQEGRGGFAGLPAAVRQGLLDNATTLGPTYASTAPDVPLDDVRRLPVPLAIVNGAQTRPYYRWIGEHLSRATPAAIYREIPDAGHMVIVEQPEETAAVIRDVLDRTTFPSGRRTP